MWNACGCTCIEGNAVNYEIIPRNSIKTTSSLSATPFSEQHLVSAAYPRMFLNDSSLYKWIISIGTSSRLHGKLTFLVGQLQLPTRLWQEVSATYMVNKVTERCKLYSSKWWTTTSWDSGAYTYQWRAFLASKTLCGLFHPVFVKSWPASTRMILTNWQRKPQSEKITLAFFTWKKEAYKRQIDLQWTTLNTNLEKRG